MSIYEASNTCHMLYLGNGLAIPVGKGNGVFHVSAVMSQCKWFRSSFLFQQKPHGTAELGLGPQVIAKQFLFHPF